MLSNSLLVSDPAIVCPNDSIRYIFHYRDNFEYIECSICVTFLRYQTNLFENTYIVFSKTYILNKYNELSEDTIKSLKKEELTTKRVLAKMTEHDVNLMTKSMGQRICLQQIVKKISRKGVQAQVK